MNSVGQNRRRNSHRDISIANLSRTCLIQVSHRKQQSTGKCNNVDAQIIHYRMYMYSFLSAHRNQLHKCHNPPLNFLTKVSMNPHARHPIRLRKLIKLPQRLRLPLNRLQIPDHLLRNLLRRKSKVLISNRARKRLPEPLSSHTESRIRVPLPAVRRVRLNYNDRSIRAAL